MKHRVLRQASLLVGLAPLLSAACSSSPGDDPSTLAVKPAAAQVATCHTQAFTATPADGVSWSVEGEGSIDASGVYTAPIRVPAPATVTVEASRGEATASATITLATAFPEPPIDTPRAGSTSAPDFVHGFVARGPRAYALVGSTQSVTLAKSDDGGLTWAQPLGVTTATGARVHAVAMDAADADTVHVLVHDFDDQAGSRLTLFSSPDAGATWASHVLFEGGNGEAQDADIVSAAPGSIIVVAPATWQDGNGGQGQTLMIWHDEAKGTGLAPLAPFDNGYDGKWSPGLEIRLASGRLTESNDGRFGPHLATNGAGKVCLAFAEYDINGVDEKHVVACSTDHGATFDDGVVVATGVPEGLNRPRVAMSADGELMVVAFNAFDDNDAIGHTQYVVSTDGGATFGAAKQHAGVTDDAGNALGVKDAEVFVDADGVIWFARTVNEQYLQIDKSCDKGETLSGAVDVRADGNLVNALFGQSSAGIFTGGDRQGDGDEGTTLVRLIAQ